MFPNPSTCLVNVHLTEEEEIINKGGRTVQTTKVEVFYCSQTHAPNKRGANAGKPQAKPDKRGN